MSNKRFNNVEMLKENRRELEYTRFEMHECSKDLVSELIPIDPEEFERMLAAQGYSYSGHKIN